MNNQHSLDRELLIPILIGALSVVGIIVVLLIGRSLNSPPEIPATPSATPFQYIYLGTEPAVTTLVAEGSELPPTEAPIVEDPNFFTPTLFSGSTPIILTPSNGSGTATSSVSQTDTPGGGPPGSDDSGPPLTPGGTAAANTYDDTDSRLSYSGTWVSQTGVSGAYQGTLHISSTVDNKVTFSFTGPEIQVAYQAGPSLGTITITIDGVGPPPISQSQTITQIKVWTPSERLSDATHIIVITHAGGGSINIDSLVVPLATPTPTKTPTP